MSSLLCRGLKRYTLASWPQRIPKGHMTVLGNCQPWDGMDFLSYLPFIPIYFQGSSSFFQGSAQKSQETRSKTQHSPRFSELTGASIAIKSEMDKDPDPSFWCTQNSDDYGQLTHNICCLLRTVLSLLYILEHLLLTDSPIKWDRVCISTLSKVN